MTNLVPHRAARLLLAAFTTAGTFACGGDSGADSADMLPDSMSGPSGAGHQVATVYAPNLGIDLAAMTPQPSGLYMRNLEPGAGDTTSAGDRVRVEYTGWLPNGVEFDASNGNPISFTIGVGDVIAGWDEGLTGMRPGGRRVLVIPPALAYGESGRPGVIPPSSTLVFDVRLIEIIADSAAGSDPATAFRFRLPESRAPAQHATPTP